MKITFIIGSLRGGGAERVMVLLANEFAKRGNEVTVITKAPECDYQLDPSVKWKKVFHQHELKSSIMNKVGRRINYLPRLYTLIKNEKSDVVISFLVGMNKNVILLCKLLGIPVIVSEHTNHTADMNFLTWLERRLLYKVADAVTVLTKYDYDKYYSHFLKNVHIMPNPISFSPVSTMKHREKIILASGSLNRWHIKGFDNLLKIFAKISVKHPGWRLQIAGSGDEGKKHLTKIIQELHIQDKVDLPGFIPDIQPLMQRASIFVLSSRYEGFGMVLVEAMSQGCACISFDCIAGPNEIINHNVDGILVEDQNLKKMEDEICRLIENEALRVSFGEYAKRNIQRFSIANIGDKWTTLINEITK